MFRQKDYQYFEMAQKVIDEYVIEPGDEMTIKVYTRDGFSIIDYSITAEGNVSVSGVSQETFIVDPEGFLTVPIIGDLYVKGYTERQLEKILADKLSGIYINPFVSVRVTNRRVYVFRGGEGSVVNINQTPTTLIEVIARSRGVSNDFKSYNIKLIRGDLKNPQIFLIDLSTIEGMRKSNLIVQSNDIIYIEPRRNVASSLFNIVFPFTTLANTFVSIIALSIALGNR
ncbi:MAG: polysaccharide biosynthesis/export family protein [Chitinophagales bacterium]|nr:polysaccharide biosynthesis/export family protein [Chitinophagales bacterium]MDW8417911.1 polysaccharide biosynthesis/export family protein [Chitinophagales bacterium]